MCLSPWRRDRGGSHATKQVLIISPVPTHPATGGNHVRVLRLAEQLSLLGNEITLLHVPWCRGSRREMEAYWGTRYRRAAYRWPARWRVPILLSRLTQATGTSCLQRWTRRCWLGNHPLDSWYDFSLGRAVTDLQAESRFDVVIVEYVIWSRALELFAPPTVRILDTHDVFTDRWKLMLQSSHCPRFWPWGSVSLSAEEERRGLDRADVVLAVQAEEARRLRTLTSRPVATVGHFTRITARPETSPDPTLVFVGSRWGPNVEGMRAFVTRVFPQIRKRVPQAALRVAGQVAGLVPAAPGVHRAGFLADSEALYRRAALAINPVPSGTGLAIKSIEALGHGCPLVTYAAGARGLSEAVGRGVLVAGSEQEFVDHVCRLLESPEEQSKRSRMALESAKEWNARQLAELIPLTEPRTPPSFRPPCRPRPAG